MRPTPTPGTQVLIAHAQVRDDGSPGFDPPRVRPTETSFRHSGWQHRRDKIRDALTHDATNWKRIDRFDNCGSCAVIEQSPTTKKVRVTCWHCHDRLCSPCQRRKAAEIRQLIEMNVGTQTSRFVTLTLDHRDEPLRDALRRLREGFAALRRSALWKRCTVGGIAVVEVTYAQDNHWHPHLHCVVTGDFIPQDELAAAWRKATGTARIVDVRLIRRQQAAMAYVTKYVVKAIDGSVVNNPDALIEYAAAMKGTRTYATFGKWKHLEEDADADDPGDWQPVCTVAEFWTAYRECEPWAIELGKSMAFRDPDDDRPRNRDRPLNTINE